jgi:hypothetical protein
MSANGQTEAPETAPASTTTEAPPETTTAAPPEPQTGGLDRLAQQMDRMAAEQRQFMESVSQQLAPPEDEEEVEFYTDEGELSEDGARAILQGLVEEQLEARLAPREAARLVTERDAAYEDLKEEYPDLLDAQIAERVLNRSVQWAHAHNPALIDRPEFVDVIEAFYKADKFDELRAAQAAEQPRPVVLESASGSRGQTRQPDEDWGERIVKAAERLKPQI